MNNECEAPLSDLTTRGSKVAMACFLLGQAAAPRDAQAYYLAGYGLLTLTTSALGVTVVGGVILTVKLVADDTASLAEPGSRTRAVVDAGLLSAQSDLGLQLALLSESPVGWNRAALEVAAGGGATLDALSATTGLSTEALCAAWTASAPQDGVHSSDDATRAVRAFVEHAGRDMRPSPEVQAELAWKLAREAQGPEGSEPTSTMIAAWLGVPQDAVIAAAADATAALAATPQSDLRGAVYADPDAFLDALSRSLEQSQAAAIDATIDRLLAEAQAAGATPEVAASI
jgi:hypothetical protein